MLEKNIFLSRPLLILLWTKPVFKISLKDKEQTNPGELGYTGLHLVKPLNLNSYLQFLLILPTILFTINYFYKIAISYTAKCIIESLK